MKRDAEGPKMLPVLIALLLAAGVSGAKDLPEGTHVLVMVVETVSRENIMASGEQGMLGRLHAAGITDADITDGSIAVGIVYCCGGNISRETAMAFFVPPEFRTSQGDVVEVRLGRVASKKDLKRGDFGAINHALNVRESFNDETGACRWDPPNEKLWMRVLYCDWMLGEGWQRRGGLSPGWFRPAQTG
ncbi:MAG: hypothetical protein KJP03_09405 [Gammaproteobacteria bacterium]|nr:hypothetical protein [Gammaproteobacteria bacterium]